jgi:hypothetical protein
MTDWKYVGHGGSGDQQQISGIRVWSHKWTCRDGERADVTDPLYGQRHCFHVYEIAADGRQITFAAGEFSNGIYGFYTPTGNGVRVPDPVSNKTPSLDLAMNPKQKNTLLAAGIISGLMSLPMTWMTIRNADIKINGGFGDLLDSAFQGMTFDVTGLNGYVTFLFKTPLWFLVAIAIVANALQLMRSSDVFAIPKSAIRIVAIAASIWVTVPTINVLLTGEATLGIGALLGLCCAAAPLVCLFVPDTKVEMREGNSAESVE